MISRDVPKPPESDTVIWRYMNDWKFDSFLGSQLWFSLPRVFEEDDPKEGTFPYLNEDPEAFADWLAATHELSAEEAEEKKRHFLSQDTKTLRERNLVLAQLCGVNCWHENLTESCSMWASYVGRDEGIAVRTTVEKLESSLTEDAQLNRPALTSVGYSDLKVSKHDDPYSLLCLKGKGFRHENEIRVIARSPWLLNALGHLTDPDMQALIQKQLCNGWKTRFEIEKRNDKGFNLPINLKGLIEELIVKPGATDDYLHSVSERLQNIGLNGIPIRHSELC